MIDHTGIGVTDVARAAVFYRAVRPCVSLKLSPVMLTMSEWWRMPSSIATLSTPSPAKALSCRSLTNFDSSTRSETYKAVEEPIIQQPVRSSSIARSRIASIGSCSGGVRRCAAIGHL